ncbi:hypothetical protein GCM10027030_12750 [Luteococcus sediminum]|uniref:acyl carrier protein n=1 Tax=Luteococcus sp. TaxID=1969402 RepID=UPI003735B9D3
MCAVEANDPGTLPLAPPARDANDLLAKNELLSALTGAVAEIIGTPAEQIAVDISLMQLGMTSQQMLRVRSRVEEITGRQLPATICWQYPTLEALTGYLLSAQEPNESHHLSLTEPIPVPEDVAVDDLLTMSDSEFEAFLNSLSQGGTHGD